MALELAILYRGPLSSCNYDCHYCPFAKHFESKEELEADKRALGRFCDWIKPRTSDQLSILFTPWGEALIRRWYQLAIVELSNLPQVHRVAIQTNLSCPLDWVDGCDLQTLALWCTWHPTQVELERFVDRCLELHERGVRISVGVVGLAEYFGSIETLRAALPEAIYVWINAYKDIENYYQEADIERLERVDPHFRWNTVRHPSFGKACRTGQSVISVDGEGDVRRCHFIRDILGNLYTDDLELMLQPRTCTNATCGCHIGYVHLEDLPLYQIYGDGILERIPEFDSLP